MNVQLTPRQLRQILTEVTKKDLKQELAKRADAQEKGKCDYCNQLLKSEPYCDIPYRHEGREPEDWEGILDTPRISKDRWTMSYWRDDGGHVSMSRFPGTRFMHLDHRVHLPCDGDGCDDPLCDGGFVGQHIDFGDNLKLKWPEDIVDFGEHAPYKKRHGPSIKKPHA